MTAYIFATAALQFQPNFHYRFAYVYVYVCVRACVFVCACVPFLQRIIWKTVIIATVLGLSNVRSRVFRSDRKLTSSITFQLFQDSENFYCKCVVLLLSVFSHASFNDNSAKLET